MYDLLQRIIFRNELRKAQISLLHEIEPTDKIAIIGGGTGWILTQIPHKNLEIDYIERSEQMIKLSKIRSTNHHVNFINSSHLQEDKKYDVVITPFVLDCIPHDLLNDFVQQIAKKVNSKWICTDFNVEDNRLRSKILTKAMIFFFKITTQIPVNKLVSYFNVIENNGFKSKTEIMFVNGFVKSQLFVKE